MAKSPFFYGVNHSFSWEHHPFSWLNQLFNCGHLPVRTPAIGHGVRYGCHRGTSCAARWSRFRWSCCLASAACRQHPGGAKHQKKGETVRNLLQGKEIICIKWSTDYSITKTNYSITKTNYSSTKDYSITKTYYSSTMKCYSSTNDYSITKTKYSLTKPYDSSTNHYSITKTCYSKTKRDLNQTKTWTALTQVLRGWGIF